MTSSHSGLGHGGGKKPSIAAHANINGSAMPGNRAVSIHSVRSHNSTTTGFHATLARRLLYPQLPASSPLPPILVSSVADPSVPGIGTLNDEIYDFIALSVRGFVLPWWSKISARDRQLPQEITAIALHLIRALEARLVLETDIVGLLIRDAPILVAQHYADYREAQAKLQTSYATTADTLPYMFHSLQPHMALKGNGKVDPNYLRQAVEHVMKACLPKEDWDAETERIIVREIIVKILLESALPKLTQPWFVHKSLLELLGLPSETTPISSPSKPGIHSLIIFALSAVQAVSGFALTAISGFQSSLHIVKQVNKSPPHQSKRVEYSTPPDLAPPALEMMAEILTMRQRGATTAILSLLYLFIGFLNNFMNKLIPYLFYMHLNVALITKVVVLSKKNLFPNGYPAPPPIDPTPEEQTILREQLEKRIFTLVPPAFTKILLGPSLEVQRRTVKDMLIPFDSPECNAHLLIVLLDLILVAVFPELGLSGVNQTSGDLLTPSHLDSRDHSPSPAHDEPATPLSGSGIPYSS